MNSFCAVVLLQWALAARATEVGPFRRIFDSTQALLTNKAGAKFPDKHFKSMTQCMDISPNLVKAQDNAWEGFVEYFAERQKLSGNESWGPIPVEWHESYQNRNWPHNYTGGKTLSMMAYNASFPSIPIYEPCNFASNIAYYRVAPEICHKAKSQSMSAASRAGFVESLAILGFGSAFFHGSDTNLGQDFDRTMIKVLAFVGHQVAVEHLDTGKPEILRDLASIPRNRSATEISRKLTDGLATSGPSQWAALLPTGDNGPDDPKDVPDFEFVFAGLVSATTAAVFPPALNKKLVHKLMGLFGLAKDKQDFIENKFLPAVSESISKVSLRWADRVSLLRKLIAFAMKIGFAFAYQESFFHINFFLQKDVNFLGGVLVPAVNLLADMLSGDSWWQKGIPLGYEVYPGNEKCRLHQPHAKWHEMSANAFLELVYVADKMNKMTSPQSQASFETESEQEEDPTVFTRFEFAAWKTQARLITLATPAGAPVEHLVKEVSDVFKALDANGNGKVTYSELTSKLADIIPDALDDLRPEAFIKRLLQASQAVDVMVV